MRTDLLIIGRKVLIDKSFDFKRLFMLLSDKGYDIEAVYAAESGLEISGIVGRISSSNIIVIGDTSKLTDALNDFDSESDGQFFRHGDNNFILMPEYDEQYIKDILIPILNSKSKAFYNTVIFKVFDKTEQDLKELLLEQIRNKNKITFSFYPSVLECEVHIRYSSNTLSPVINEIVGKVGEILAPFAYAYSDISLTKQTIKHILAANKRLSIAETFTRGGIAKELSSGKNIDALLLESIVISSESSLKSRLGVDAATISRHGMVSDETAYVMAGSLFSNPECDLALAVLGSVSAADAEECDSVFYIAVGNRTVVHVFTQHYFGNKSEITEAGIKYALFTLFKFINEEKSQ